MNPIKRTLRRATISLLTLPFLVAIAGIADVDPAAADEMNADTSSPAARSGETGAEKPVWDWHVNPQNYAPDGLSNYSEDYTNAAQDVAGADPATKETAPSATAAQADVVGIR